jgi:hypothetical protein
MTSAIIGSSIAGGKIVPSSASDVGVKDGVTLIAGGVNVEYEVAKGVGSMIATSEAAVGVAIGPGVQLITLTAK